MGHIKNAPKKYTNAPTFSPLKNKNAPTVFPPKNTKKKLIDTDIPLKKLKIPP